MIGANTIPFLLLPPAPFWMRIVSSIAAPLFIFIAGMMFALITGKKYYDLKYSLLRGGFIVLTAALLETLDLGIVPFLDMDILYLIGISFSVTNLFLKLKYQVQWILIGIVLCAASLLQMLFGYSEIPLRIPITSVGSGIFIPPILSIIRQWTIEGWFPIFPWIGLSLLGTQFGMIRWYNNRINMSASEGYCAIAGFILLFCIMF